MNILLCFCRELKGYSTSQVARALAIGTEDYLKIENGQEVLSRSQINKLQELYKVKTDLFLDSVIQLFEFKNAKLDVSRYKIENEQLTKEVKRLDSIIINTVQQEKRVGKNSNPSNGSRRLKKKSIKVSKHQKNK